MPPDPLNLLDFIVYVHFPIPLHNFILLHWQVVYSSYHDYEEATVWTKLIFPALEINKRPYYEEIRCLSYHLIPY
jgi:hypothetical protein